MLHLSAVLQSAVTGHTDKARAHLDEAAETASRTGDGTFAGLNFGPRNVGVWRVALAVEFGEPGRVPELARDVEVAAIPSAGRDRRTRTQQRERGRLAMQGRCTDDGSRTTLLLIHELNGSWTIHGLGTPGTTLSNTDMVALCESILERAR